MRVAVVGTGIAGLGAAYVLSREHEVTLFEREPTPGGHTRTVQHVEGGRELALDTGFIVHNERNYPSLVRLFQELGIETRPSDMSFSVSCARCRLEYSGRRPLARPGHALRPGFVRMLRDVVRFLRTAGEYVEGGRFETATLAELVEAEGYSGAFRDHFLVPLVAAIWSTAPAEALGFPAVYAVRFLDNHGMLGFRRFEWRTVSGGSRRYVDAVLERIGSPARLHCPVVSLARTADGVEVRDASGQLERFDRAVVATHADEALALLEDPSDDERRILGAFRSTRNDTVLHTDERLLPRAAAARASWNFHIEDCRAPAARPTVTYYLNRLQGLETRDRHYCVTLNRSADICDDAVIERIAYDHPLYTHESLAAQARLPSLNCRNTVYCGAYHGYGFHEDGLVSGIAAARALGVGW